jgi:hypothetical protein
VTKDGKRWIRDQLRPSCLQLLLHAWRSRRPALPPLEHAWTRYVHGKWDRELAHNSDYDIAKTLELVLHL